jgi:HEAT repeat protein
MLSFLKTWQLSSAIKSKGNTPEAFSAILELGRIGNAKAVDLLMDALDRKDGVARSAARELAKIGDARALPALIQRLGAPEVHEAAASALVLFGPKAVEPLMAQLKNENALVRSNAAWCLGELRDNRAVDALIQLLQEDGDYPPRIAAATALGQLKDQRALWSLVATLKLRDETTVERQTALDQLRTAATLAMRKIGDPLATGGGVTVEATAQAALEKLEQQASLSEVHPRLIGDVALLSERELIGVMKELVTASEEISWANVENRQPMLAPYFNSYEQRRNIADTIGKELQRRGGPKHLEQILARDLGNYGSIQNWWKDLEEAKA